MTILLFFLAFLKINTYRGTELIFGPFHLSSTFKHWIMNNLFCFLELSVTLNHGIVNVTRISVSYFGKIALPHSQYHCVNDDLSWSLAQHSNEFSSVRKGLQHSFETVGLVGGHLRLDQFLDHLATIKKKQGNLLFEHSHQIICK